MTATPLDADRSPEQELSLCRRDLAQSRAREAWHARMPESLTEGCGTVEVVVDENGAACDLRLPSPCYAACWKRANRCSTSRAAARPNPMPGATGPVCIGRSRPVMEERSTSTSWSKKSPSAVGWRKYVSANARSAAWRKIRATSFPASTAIGGASTSTRRSRRSWTARARHSSARPIANPASPPRRSIGCSRRYSRPRSRLPRKPSFRRPRAGATLKRVSFRQDAELVERDLQTLRACSKRWPVGRADAVPARRCKETMAGPAMST